MRHPRALLLLAFLASPALAADIEIIPVTLSEARAYFKPENFQQNSAEAAKAGVDLNAQGRRFVAQGYANGRAFILFYNHARARDCGRDYLIQRICLTDTRDMGGGEVLTRRTYLVEALKLDHDKRTQRPDEHRTGYSIGEARRRTVMVEYELGCGEVPGQAEGVEWPFSRGSVHRLIANHTADGTLYSTVNFDHSRVYRTTLESDGDGRHSIVAPDFLP